MPSTNQAMPRFPLAFTPSIRDISDHQSRRLAIWAIVVMFAYFLTGIAGSEPFSGGHVDPAAVSRSGNLTRQIPLMALFLAATPLVLFYRARVWALCRSAHALLLLFSWIGVTALWSAHPDLTIRRLIAELIVLWIAFGTIASMRSPRELAYALFYALALLSVVNFLSLFLVPDLAIGPIGALGLHHDKNGAGSAAMLATIIIGGVLLVHPDWKHRLLAGLSLAAAGYFLYMTQSKTSFGVAVLVCAVFPILYVIFQRWRLAPFLLPLLLVIGVASAVLLIAVFDVTGKELLTLVFGDPTLSRRTELWDYLFYSIEQRQFLGHGWSAFWNTGAQINPINAPRSSWVLDANVINEAHNSYVDMWLQAGLIGLLLEILLIARCFWIYGKLLRDVRISLSDRHFLAVLLCCAVALVLNSFTESILFNGRPLGVVLTYVYLVGELWNSVGVSAAPNEAVDLTVGSIPRKRQH
jgi:exopolysaccharide production protein ExoQ